ncbi:hypothetical protein QQ73_09315, partial [Candidatus Endoriftia persephone str. Guaymas]|nr:hypothetical protein [Candidatus Endoriftia persephone str. Guaymas]
DPATGAGSYPRPFDARRLRPGQHFFDRFAAGGSHADYLSPAELRLLSEWLDIGAQYWNNPFDIPRDE